MEKKIKVLSFVILSLVLALAIFLIFYNFPNENSSKSVTTDILGMISSAESNIIKVGYNFSYGFLDHPTLYRNITEKELENLKVLNNKSGEKICYTSGQRGCYDLFSNCAVLWNITLVSEANKGRVLDIFVIHDCGEDNLYFERYSTPSPTLDELIRLYPDSVEEVRLKLEIN